MAFNNRYLTLERVDKNTASQSPMVGILMAVVVLNWFLFFGISMYLGGDALNTLPSRDGFILKSHGNHIAVSEPVWLFSLFYSSATLLLTPFMFFVIVITQQPKPWGQGGRWTKWVIATGLGVWITLWYGGIGSSVYRSVKDWRNYKSGNELLERQSPKDGAPK